MKIYCKNCIHFGTDNCDRMNCLYTEHFEGWTETDKHSGLDRTIKGFDTSPDAPYDMQWCLYRYYNRDNDCSFYEKDTGINVKILRWNRKTLNWNIIKSMLVALLMAGLVIVVKGLSK